MSVAAFARLVGVRPPYVFQVIKGSCPLAAPQIDRWADALKLAGEEREVFIVAAWLIRTPPLVREYVEGLRKRSGQKATKRR
mgnify:CR=1 FL=1|jgi:hypothetical protein